MDVLKSLWEATLRALPSAIKAAAAAVRGKRYSVSAPDGKPVKTKVQGHVKKRSDLLHSRK